MHPELTAVIVDDEALAIGVIESYLRDFPSVTIKGTFTASKKAAGMIPALKPDLLFLDVQMPAMDGFQLLDAIAGAHQPYIIFTTAYDRYAIQAFEVNALGYLLKPFDREKFGKVMDRFLHQYGKSSEHAYKQLLELLRERQQAVDYPDKIMIRELQRVFYLPLDEVCYFEAAGDYVKVLADRRQYLVHDSLQALEQKLSPEQFLRIHRSHLVNTSQIQEFIPYFNGEYTLVMKNGATLKMSRNYKENLRRAFPGL